MRSTLKLPKGSRGSAPGDGATRFRPASPPAPRAHSASTDGLHELLGQSLWPLVAAAFQDAEERVEARFLLLDDLQIVISRTPPPGTGRHEAARRVTLEVWPAVGPRLLEVEWSGGRPHVVHRRAGDWLPRLARAARRFK